MNRAGLGVGASLLARLPCKSTGLSLFFVYIPSTFRLHFVCFISAIFRQLYASFIPGGSRGCRCYSCRR